MPTSTPALAVDLDQVDRNCLAVAQYAAGHRLAWRPHVKTHKSVRMAQHQLAAGASGLTCATLREAEVMATVCDDLLLAYPPVDEARARRAAALATHVRLGVMLDSLASAERLSAALVTAGATARVLIEVDAGMRRTGVGDPSSAVGLAQAVHALPSLTFDGFGFYPGHLRSAGAEVDAELARLSTVVQELRASAASAGLSAATISCGSTPLLWRSHEIAGITEIRAGTAVYFDRTSVLGGVASWRDCAAHVVATVVSTAVPGQAVVDAGVKAIGREPLRGSEGDGYACVAGHPEVPVVRLSEEHGILDLSRTDWQPALGEVVRLIPNHVCIAVHCFDAMRLSTGEVVPIEARGREVRGER